MSESLRTLVQQLADEPTPANQDAFYRALIVAQIAVPLQTVPPSLGPGKAVADGQFAVPTIQGPNGSTMLLVYTDQEAANQAPQARGCFTVAAAVVLKMAADNHAGIFVANGYGADASWSGVLCEHVPALLAGKFTVPTHC